MRKFLLNDIAVPLKTGGEIGRVIYADEKESQDYIDHLVSTIGSELAGLHILVDCATARPLPLRPGCLTGSRPAHRRDSRRSRRRQHQ